MNSSDALFGRTKKALLSALFAKPDEAFYMNELVRSLGKGSGAVQREVKNLESAGLVVKTRHRNRRFYRANTEHLLFPEIQQMISKFSIEQTRPTIRHALGPLKPRINKAFLFGSVAKGTAKPESDVDLMVVGDITFGDLIPRLAKVEAKLHREINPVIYSQAEYEKKLQSGDHFLNAVAQGKREFLIGTADDI